MKKRYNYDVELNKPGSHGFKKLNKETGKEDIRTRSIPSESGLVKRLSKIIDSKKGKH